MRAALAGRVLAILAASTVVAACTSIPDGVVPVRDFELERYLGRWYEIARLDHSFERGLSDVSAEYSLRSDGGVDVVNRGTSAEDGESREARGRAYFVGVEDEGHLKVSFFGPFYGSYVVFELGAEYEYSFVSGPDRSYLWLLAREPHVEPELIDRFRARAEALGFDLGDLILVEHGGGGR